MYMKGSVPTLEITQSFIYFKAYWSSLMLQKFDNDGVGTYLMQWRPRIQEGLQHKTVSFILKYWMTDF